MTPPATSTASSASSTANGERSSIVSMRQEHRAGEKFFVDYSGQTVPIVDASTGEIRQAQMFVGVMGGSNQTYAEATWTQSLPDWTGSHARAFAFLGAVPHCLVPDNLRSAVTKTCRYEPDLNPTYTELADHYGTAIVPARVRHPKDKAKVEGGVLIAQRFILASLRNRTFFSLAEANAAIRERLILLNNRPFRKLPGCRQSRFEEIDLPAMLPLPATPYQYAQWKKARVHIDYHVELEGHFYSVPHRLVKEQVELRYTETIVECFYKGNRVASHPRSSVQGIHTTTPEHMPKAHREFAAWTPAADDLLGSPDRNSDGAGGREHPVTQGLSRAWLPLLHGDHLAWPSAIPKNGWKRPVNGRSP